LNTSLELLNMDSAEPSLPVHNEWKKSFHDEIDIGSERSDAGLITEDPTRRWSEQRVRRFSVRLIIECVLVVLVVGLSAGIVTERMHGHRSLTGYGPSCESSYRLTMREVSHLTRPVPTKKVMFGNAAGIGPKLVYADNEMLRNATRLREVHENWQALFPSEHLAISLLKENSGALFPYSTT
jgi:hypothetical protein